MIEVVNLWKRFGQLQVLKGLTLTIEDGETLVILGRSGVGKSVLLKHLIGLLDPDEGRIVINGLVTTNMKQSQLYKSLRGMGMLFQGAALFDSLTVGENVAFFLRQHADLKTGKYLSPGEVRDRVASALEMVDLPGAENKMPADLSGGMKKRAALARLIAYQPSILLYDEPTTGLDPITAMQINRLIVETQEKLGATSIVVTHDIHSALYVGDRLALHNDGKIAHVAPKDEFVKLDDPMIRDFLESSGHSILSQGEN